MEPVVLEYRPQDRALEDALRAALDGGAPQVVLNLDSLDTLDTEGVRGLISLLRYARSVGADLALRSTKPEVLRTLSVTALDRIFALVEAKAA